VTNILNNLTIKGFKSIRSLTDFQLNSVNVLIGANGAGKSNFIEVFQMLRNMIEQNFQGYLSSTGTASDFLYNGPETTESMFMHFKFGQNEYKFDLIITPKDTFKIKYESEKYVKGNWKLLGDHEDELLLPIKKNESGLFSPHGVSHYVYNAISNWMVYHFSNTGLRAKVRLKEIIEHSERLEPDASNLAPVLWNIQKSDQGLYKSIVDTIRTVAPFFEDFKLDPEKYGDKTKVTLTWKQKGSNYPMQPYHFSDGTLRFICLVTALLQPNSPSTILIDEPELGLHPFAIAVFAELVKAVSERTQIILSTQTPILVDLFQPEDVIIVNRKDGETTFERLQSEDLKHWLEDYSLGELWRKNVIKGGPSHE